MYAAWGLCCSWLPWWCNPILPEQTAVYLYRSEQDDWIRFVEPLATFSAYSTDQILPTLRSIERQLQENGGYAAGLIAYEAASGFDSALPTQRRGNADFPLLWFRCFAGCEPAPLPESGGSLRFGDWRPSIDEVTYRARLEEIFELIREGALYQTNFTFRMRSEFRGDPLAHLASFSGYTPPYSAILDTGRHLVVSHSPELFFTMRDGRIFCKPMKGTGQRGLTPETDETAAARLRNSAKDRSENLMILDMIRNDLGRIARIGSVQAGPLFELEAYPGVWQMTSSVQAISGAAVSEVLTALFPCASVTGAPKAAAMQAISRLECSPRGLYTGSVGYFDARGNARFNVAIRTLVMDRETCVAEYGTGSGIVWESRVEDEYHECRLKVTSAMRPMPEFQLLETIRWAPDEGFFLLDYHLRRLQGSARYFGFRWSRGGLLEQLQQVVANRTAQAHRVRVLLSRSGKVLVEALPLDRPNGNPVCLGLADNAIDRESPFFYHKTTHRSAYRNLRSPDSEACDDVVLYNSRGEVTETTIANLVIRRNDALVTPPVHCGLLPGTFRQWLLDQGEIEEQPVTLPELRRAEEIWVVNSVRKWRRAVLLKTDWADAE